jgi:sugar lactone lactonase YvrE
VSVQDSARRDGNIYFCDGLVVYRVKRDGAVLLATRDCQQPAGVALAPNQQKLYVADSTQRTVRVFAISGDGRLNGRNVFAEFKSAAKRIPNAIHLSKLVEGLWS